MYSLAPICRTELPGEPKGLGWDAEQPVTSTNVKQQGRIIMRTSGSLVSPTVQSVIRENDCLRGASDQSSHRHAAKAIQLKESVEHRAATHVKASVGVVVPAVQYAPA